MMQAGGRLGLVVLACCCASACPKTTTDAPDAPPSAVSGDDEVREHQRWLFLAGQRVATVNEQFDGATRTLTRRSSLDGSPDDTSTIVAWLNARGVVEEASYERRGPRGDRSLKLQARQLLANGRSRPLSDKPIMLLEALCYARRAAAGPVEWVDLATGESLLGALVVDAEGIRAEDAYGGVIAQCAPTGRRVGPGAFVEVGVEAGAVLPASSASPIAPPVTAPPHDGARVLLGGRGIPFGALGIVGPGQRVEGNGTPSARAPFAALQRPIVFDRAAADTTRPAAADARPGLFLESDDPAVAAFAREHTVQVTVAADGRRSAVADALALAEAIGRTLDTSGGGGPPSAVGALGRRAGDCDDATALLVSSLRALGHPARPVVGYRAAGGRWVPHAWAEVFDGERWLPADAMVPGLGPFATHLRLFEGLGSPLTLGRTLGALEIVSAPEG